MNISIGKCITRLLILFMILLISAQLSLNYVFADSWVADIDDGMDNALTVLNHDPQNGIGYVNPQTAEYDGKLYLTWVENNSSNNAQVRVCEYDGTNWTFIDGDGENGLNFDPSQAYVYSVSIAVSNGVLYVAWDEWHTTNPNGTFSHISKYNGTPGSWTPIDGGDAYGIRYNTTIDTAPTTPVYYLGNNIKLIDYNNKLYAVWSEHQNGGPDYNIVLKSYDGSSWSLISEKINDSDKAYYPSLAVHNGDLFIAYEEGSAPKHIRVKKYNPETGFINITPDGPLNYNAAASGDHKPLLASDGTNLYAVWNETGAAGKMQMRAKKYDGTAWTSIDGEVGLNYNPSQYSSLSSLIEFDGDIYVCWTEENSSQFSQMRIKRYDSGTDTWTFVDDNGLSGGTGLSYGLNLYPDEYSATGILGRYNNEQYLFWTENKKLYTKKYDSEWNITADAANLKSLQVSSGSLYPAFNGNTENYAVLVDNDVTSVTVTPEVLEPNATISVNGKAVASGVASQEINLEVGSNDVVIRVTSHRGVLLKKYVVKFVRYTEDGKILLTPKEDVSLYDDGTVSNYGTETCNFVGYCYGANNHAFEKFDFSFLQGGVITDAVFKIYIPDYDDNYGMDGITGNPQFDFYYSDDDSWDETAVTLPAIAAIIESGITLKKGVTPVNAYYSFNQPELLTAVTSSEDQVITLVLEGDTEKEGCVYFYSDDAASNKPILELECITNDVPEAADATLNVTEDTPTAGTLSASDGDGDDLTYSIVTQGTKGTVTINNAATGEYTYTPNANATGADSFTFKVNDGKADSNIATITVTITEVNDDPIIVKNTGKTIVEGAEGSITSSELQTSDVDTAAENLTYKLTAVPANGLLKKDGTTLEVDDTFTQADLDGNLISYAHDGSETVTDSFSFTVSDGAGGSIGEMTFNITINPVNDAPTLTSVSILSGAWEDTEYTIYYDDLAAAADETDAEMDSISFIVQDVSSGLLVKDGSPVVLGTTTLESGESFVWKPEANKNGVLNAFTIVAYDGEAASAVPVQVKVEVTPVNDLPEAIAVDISTAEDTVKTGYLSGTDIDGDVLTYSKVSDPAHGTVIVNNDGSYTYTPEADYNGADSFTFKVNDGIADSAAALVSIEINAVNDQPVPENITKNGVENTTLQLTVTDFIYNDIEGDPLRAVKIIVVPETNTGFLKLDNINIEPGQEIEVGQLDKITFVPAAYWNGVTTFKWKASDDGISFSNTEGVITLDFLGVNDAPEVSDISINTDEDTAKSVILTAVDKDGDSVVFSIVDQPLHGTLDFVANGSYIYTPAANYYGTDCFRFRASDGIALSNIAEASISINSVNDIPVISDIVKATDENTPVEFETADFTTHFSDIEGSDLYKVQFTTVTDAVYGKMELISTGGNKQISAYEEVHREDLGKLRFVPKSGVNNVTASFRWRASDGEDYSGTAALNIGIGSNAVDIAEAKAAISIGYAAGDSASSVTKDISLPGEGLRNTQITWTTDNEERISRSGKVTRPSWLSGDEEVTVTASVYKGGMSDTIDFHLHVIKLPMTDAEAVLLDKAAIEITYAAGDTVGGITSNIGLPTAGSSGTSITWTSDNTGVISNDGIVTRPVYSAGDKVIKLTALISKGTASGTVVFTVTVKEQAPSPKALLKTLSATNVTLTPAFEMTVMTYRAQVSYSVTKTTVTAEAEDGTASIKVNGESPIEGKKEVALAVGSNTISIEVTAEDGISRKIYTVTVIREGQKESDKDEKTSTPETTVATTTPAAGTTTPTSVLTEVIVNGQVQNAGTTTTVTVESQTVTIVTVDHDKIEEKLDAEEKGVKVVIPVSDSSDVVVGELNGQTVKKMQEKEAILEIKTESASYTLPASEIDIDSVSGQIGQEVELNDIRINVSIAVPPADTVKIVEDIADKNSYQIVVKPIEFEITCISGDKKVSVSKFNGYVERTIAIPEGLDPSQITTGIILNNDGTFSHVPTTIIAIDGKYYAKINSLTNSTYSVIYSPKAFRDVENHWAKDAVNDMASRLVIDGIGDGVFEPDRSITRSEFATVVIRALGLMRSGTGKDIFNDVSKDAWYYDSVSMAYEYGIISGYSNGKFGAAEKVTREQAMTMIARAIKLTGLKVTLSESETEKLLAGFDDSENVADWAKESMAACIKTGISTGRSVNTLAPKEEITRAEAAVLVRRLLQKSNLINL